MTFTIISRLGNYEVDVSNSDFEAFVEKGGMADVSYFNSLLYPVRTASLLDFCKDFFIPGVSRVIDADCTKLDINFLGDLGKRVVIVVVKAIFAVPLFVVDVVTVPLRFVTAIPRVHANRERRKELPVKFSPEMEAEGSVIVQVEEKGLRVANFDQEAKIGEYHSIKIYEVNLMEMPGPFILRRRGDFKFEGSGNVNWFNVNNEKQEFDKCLLEASKNHNAKEIAKEDNDVGSKKKKLQTLYLRAFSAELPEQEVRDAVDSILNTEFKAFKNETVLLPFSDNDLGIQEISIGIFGIDQAFIKIKSGSKEYLMNLCHLGGGEYYWAIPYHEFLPGLPEFVEKHAPLQRLHEGELPVNHIIKQRGQVTMGLFKKAVLDPLEHFAARPEGFRIDLFLEQLFHHHSVLCAKTYKSIIASDSKLL